MSDTQENTKFVSPLTTETPETYACRADRNGIITASLRAMNTLIDNKWFELIQDVLYDIPYRIVKVSGTGFGSIGTYYMTESDSDFTKIRAWRRCQYDRSIGRWNRITFEARGATAQPPTIPAPVSIETVFLSIDHVIAASRIGQLKIVSDQVTSWNGDRRICIRFMCGGDYVATKHPKTGPDESIAWVRVDGVKPVTEICPRETYDEFLDKYIRDAGIPASDIKAAAPDTGTIKNLRTVLVDVLRELEAFCEHTPVPQGDPHAIRLYHRAESLRKMFATEG
jgi:hypothetical protein